MPESSQSSAGSRPRSGMRLEDRSWIAAAAHPDTLDDQLGGLGQEWSTVTAVDLGDRRRAIATVVIGPAGVFTITAAEHPDSGIWIRGDGFVVDGMWVGYLPETRREVDRIDRALSTAVGEPVHVRGVVALIADPDRVAIKHQPDDVHVAAPGTLRSWLLSLPAVFDAETVARICLVVRRSAATAHRRAG